MFGLIISDPSQNTARRAALSARLYELDLPLSGFTEDAASLFPADMPRNAFLRAASAAGGTDEPPSRPGSPARQCTAEIPVPAIIAPALPAARPEGASAGRTFTKELH